MICSIDFEFSKPSNPDMGLVCAALSVDGGEIEKYWLLDGSDNQKLHDRLIDLAENDASFSAYAVQLAEGRCFLALGLDPRRFRWHDLYSEWKWLRNGDNRYLYGDVIVTENGKDPYVAVSIPPEVKITKRMTREEEQSAKLLNDAACKMKADRTGKRVVNNQSGESLLDCEYFLGVIDESTVLADKAVKNDVRNFIIAGQDLESRKQEILDYCASDIKLLYELDLKIGDHMAKVMDEPHINVQLGKVRTDFKANKYFTLDELREEIGSWAARNAMYAMRGIPLNAGRLEAVKKAGPLIRVEEQLRWNELHPEYPLYRIGKSAKALSLLKAMRKKSPYLDMEVTEDYDLFADAAMRISKAGKFRWKKTPSGAFAKDSDYLKELDDGGLIHDIRKHKDSIKALKSISPEDDGTYKIDRFIGCDFKQRPNFNPYGTKTGRNAPSATSFLFLMPKWMRLLVNPREGRYICDLDAHSEEVAIAAALYNDDNKREVYRSADVYMKYAQLAGAYPKDKPILTEDERESEKWFKEEGWSQVRKIYKGGFLGMQFGMGGASLERRVRLSLPEEKRDEIFEGWGDSFVDSYRSLFSNETECVTKVRQAYSNQKKGVMLQDGWRLGPDDPNILSVSNFPVQGTGSVILRRCCELCDAEGIQIYATLHDAISFTGKLENMEREIDTARECFRRAAEDILGENLMVIGNPEIIKHDENWIHDPSVPGTWNLMAEKYFPEFVLPS